MIWHGTLTVLGWMGYRQGSGCAQSAESGVRIRTPNSLSLLLLLQIGLQGQNLLLTLEDLVSLASVSLTITQPAGVS